MEMISLLEAEPDLGSALDAEQRAAASASLRAPVVKLSAGQWDPPQEGVADGFGYLVVGGTLLRRVEVERGSSVELLGVGDCLLPWRQEPSSFSRAEWEVVERTGLAVLDMRPGASLSQWPAVAATIAGRAIDRSRRLAVQSAIMSIVGIDDRLHALLWTMAERWGEMTTAGARLDVKVSQATLGEMVGARRPTVSLAFKSLTERGSIEPDGPGVWLLHGCAPEIAGTPEFDR